MSGFNRDKGTYQLTGPKCEWWHRFCTCGARGYAEIMERHAYPAGFVAVGRYDIAGPGLAEGSTDALYAAISGREIDGSHPAWGWESGT